MKHTLWYFNYICTTGIMLFILMLLTNDLITENININAAQKVVYSVTLETPQNGIIAFLNESNSVNELYVPSGTEVEFYAAVTDEKYKLEDIIALTDTGIMVPIKNKDYYFSFIMPDENVIIQASFSNMITEITDNDIKFLQMNDVLLDTIFNKSSYNFAIKFSDRVNKLKLPDY